MVTRRAAVMPVLGHEGGEHAFAQTSVGDAHPLARPDPEQRLEDGTAGEHEIGPFVTNAWLRHAIGIAHGDQVGRDGAGVACAEPTAVDAGALINRKIEMDTGNGRDRARGAEEVGLAACRPFGEAVLGLEGRNTAHHVRDHRLIIRRSHLAAPMPLGKTDHPDRQRRPGGNAILRVEAVVDGASPRSVKPPEIEPDQLRAAAANIEDEHPIAVAIDE